MPTGTVKFFRADKGFGFIVPDEGGPDLFVHISGLADGTAVPTQGMRVTFELGTDRKSNKTRRPTSNWLEMITAGDEIEGVRGIAVHDATPNEQTLPALDSRGRRISSAPSQRAKVRCLLSSSNG